MKTSELTGAALNWAVAKCEGATEVWQIANGEWIIEFKGVKDWFDQYEYSTDWRVGGPIIEREGITIARRGKHSCSEWGAVLNDFEFDEEGTTPLIAAMRCFVASKLGDEVEIPEELQ